MNLFNHPLTEKNAVSILNALPPCRRQTYLNIARHKGAAPDEEQLAAAQLYVWNGYLASAADRVTGEAEVLLRNFMDKALAAWNSHPDRGGSSNWIENPVGILEELINPQSGSRLMDKVHLTQAQGTPTHDDYVAGLTFGNWVHLLPKPHAHAVTNTRLNLWEDALRPSLPDPNTDRVAFQRNAMQAKEMRNRATHRRPLIKDLSQLAKTHQSCIELTKAINPEIGEWLRREGWIPAALRQYPLA